MPPPQSQFHLIKIKPIRPHGGVVFDISRPADGLLEGHLLYYSPFGVHPGQEPVAIPVPAHDHSSTGVSLAAVSYQVRSTTPFPAAFSTTFARGYGPAFFLKSGGVQGSLPITPL